MNIQAERIHELMQQRNMSYGELAKHTNIAKSALQRYATGETAKIPLDRIELIAKALNASPAYIMGWSDSPDKSLPDDALPYNPVMHKIPVLGVIAAGLPLYAEQNIEDYTYTELNGGAEYFALRVKGDSMTAANIPDKSLVIVRKQETVENGQIAVVMVNDENATVKRFRQDKNIVTLSPQSYNLEHDVQVYNLKKDRIRIVGKVVECKTTFE